MTLLGAAVGFGAGASIGFGLNVFEDRQWRREGVDDPTVVLTDGEVQRLSRTVSFPPPMEPRRGGQPPSSLTVRVSDSDVERLLDAITTQITKHHGR